MKTLKSILTNTYRASIITCGRLRGVFTRNEAMTDHEAIQGEWVSIAPGKTGYRIPIGSERIGSKLRYQLDSDVVPKQIYLEHRDPGSRPRSSARGVYELTGDMLKIRWAYADEAPPKSMEMPEDGSRVLMLKRVV